MNSTSDKNDEWPLTARMVEDFRTMHMEEAEEGRHRYPEGVADEVKRRVNMICDAALTTLRPPIGEKHGLHDGLRDESSRMATTEAQTLAAIEGDDYEAWSKDDLISTLKVIKRGRDRLREELAARSATDALDARRLDWLDLPGHWIESHEDDAVKSWHEPRKQAHFYINGKYTKAEGATARAAIDAAMAALDGGAKNG